MLIANDCGASESHNLLCKIKYAVRCERGTWESVNFENLETNSKKMKICNLKNILITFSLMLFRIN